MGKRQMNQDQFDFDQFRKYLRREKNLELPTAEHIVENLVRLFNKNALKDKESFDQWADEFIDSGKANSYYNKYVQTLHKYCEYVGVSWGKSIKYRPVEESSREAFTIEETNAFLSITKFPTQSEETYKKWRAFWYFCVFTGCRPIEMLRMRKDHVNLAAKEILFDKTKTKQRRKMVIEPQLYPILYEHMQIVEGDLLFYKKPGVMMSNNAYIKDFKARCKVLNISTIQRKPYSFRHGFITRHLQKARNPLFVVQDMVGHKDPNTTRMYYHGNMDDMHDAGSRDPVLPEERDPFNIIHMFEEYIESHRLQEDKRFDYPLIKEAIAMLHRSVKST